MYHWTVTQLSGVGQDFGLARGQQRRTNTLHSTIDPYAWYYYIYIHATLSCSSLISQEAFLDQPKGAAWISMLRALTARANIIAAAAAAYTVVACIEPQLVISSCKPLNAQKKAAQRNSGIL